MASQALERTLVTIAEAESLELAARASVGRIAHVSNGRMSVIPVNFLLEGSDVLIRTADGTELLAAARRRLPAAFQVDDVVDWSCSGWSVLIRGQLAELTDPEVVGRVLGGTLRPWSAGSRNRVVRLVGTEVTGRRIEPGGGGISTVRL